MGNKHENEGALYNVWAEQAGQAALYLTRCMHGRMYSDYDVSGINFRGPTMDSEEVLAVVKGFAEDGSPVVAFHGASTFSECLIGVAARLRNGSLKWKVDQYAKDNGTGKVR